MLGKHCYTLHVLFLGKEREHKCEVILEISVF